MAVLRPRWYSVSTTTFKSLRLEVQRSNHSDDSGPDPDGSDDSAAEDDQQSDSTQESNGGQRSGETDSEDALTTA